MDIYGVAGPLLRLLPPETAHRLSVRALAWGLGPRAAGADDPLLASRLWGLDFANPVGLAAGFDKNAEAVPGALAMGFGFVEIGSVTPLPQPGNPKPRLFRLTEDRAVINRMGFNSDGLDAVCARLARAARGARAGGPVGGNLGKNLDSDDAAADYARGAAALAPHCDYLVVNVSSPNTPGLRALQSRDALISLLRRVRDAVGHSAPPLVLKIAPDLIDADKTDVARVALDFSLDGLIVGNTTITRPAGLVSRHRGEAGGLSGRPLAPLAARALADMYRLTEGRIPLVACGGVADGRDAYARIRAGASLVQIYTALIYQGPGLVARIKRELAESLRTDGFRRLADAVGAGHR